MVFRYLITFMLALVSIPAFAQSIDDVINEALNPVSDFLFTVVFFKVPIFGGIPFVLISLVGCAVFFTFYLNFINFRGFKHALDLVRGKYADPTQKGEVSHFQALATALSGTVGLGNIGGVAAAISVGGPGATFWMILAGFLGMSSKFAECTLGVKYRNEYEDGRVSGGPMYYISKGFAEMGLGPIGKVIAAIFAVSCIGGALGGGNMYQANQAFKQFVGVTGGEASFFYDKGWLFGLILAAGVALVIIGGIRSIAKVTEKIVPFMAVLYLICGLIIIGMHYTHIPDAFGQIISGAFAPEGIAGGFVGVLIQGFQRAAFSNEAGIGSASIAHSAVRTSEPVSEGMVAVLEPFIDTVVICTVTALVIIISGAYDAGNGIEGISLTSAAFASVISWFPNVLALAAILFAFSTMIAWSYYGRKAWTYLLGETAMSELVYKMIFCSFTIIGCSASLGAVLNMSDALFFAMAFSNIIGLIVLRKVVHSELSVYWRRLKEHKITRA
ncbi:MAG: alanine glycine permease [Kangiellaceae bacterium]|nr:alanine glycine permease [Kangiellaceae bacterium]